MTYAPYDDEDDEPTSERRRKYDQRAEIRASVERLTRDLAAAARTMGPKEARFLVDAYYTLQENRKRAASQAKALEKGVEVDGETKPEPHVLIDWLFDQSRILEAQIKRALDQYTQGHVMGEWMRQIVGIGPVIAAGMLANLEEPRPTAGKVYAFAGLAADGQKAWKAGEKRPYNQRLKTLCWHAGQSFMKLAARDDCYYGHHYRDRKAFEQQMSAAGKRAETAADWVKRVGKTTEAFKHYSAGHLPPGQIDARARRWAVKLFLSHMNEVWLTKLGRPVVAPFVMVHGDGKGGAPHTHYIPPPIAA